MRMIEKCIKLLLVLGMLAGMCGTASAAVGIIAETQTTSSGSTPVCTAPCECISEADAAARWGAEGYDRCSKTICGQSANAMVQYYCFHQIGGVSSVAKSGISSPAATTVVQTIPSTQTPVLTTVQSAVQTPAQTTVTTAAAANPSPSYTWPAPGVTPQQRTPVAAATVFAALGIAVLVLVLLKN